MKTKITLIILAVAALSFTKRPIGLTDAERNFAKEYLLQTKNELTKSLTGLSPEQLVFKSAPDRWSITECVEHIALAEIGLWKMAEGSLKEPANPPKRNEIAVSDQDVINRLTNRSGKAQSPEIIKPTGKFPDTKTALQAFETQRTQTIHYLSATQDDLRNHFSAHPVTGTIDVYQLILLTAAHSKRHILQIEEVKSAANFPRQ